MKKSTTILILMLGFAGAFGATAGEIYMWTDENGNVQYGDRPVEGAVLITNIESKSTDNNRVQATTQARLDKQATAREVTEEADELAREESLEEAEASAAACESARTRLQNMLKSRRLYRKDANGDRVYLDDNEMNAARAIVTSQVEDHCSS
jgi:uncharacterized protein YaiL (DUF2058 family)